MKYQLEISEKQASLICEALECYSRLSLGQLEIYNIPVLFEKNWKNNKNNDYSNVVDDIDNHLYQIKKHVFNGDRITMSPSAYNSIGSADDDMKVLYDIFNQLKYEMSEVNLKKKTVGCYKPTQLCEKEKVKIKRLSGRYLKMRTIVKDTKTP